jgi:chromosome partitioning protein
MPKTVVIANQKGGGGKTTTAVNSGRYLAQNGKKVLMIDIDPQGNSCTGLGVGMKNREGAGIYEVLIGQKSLREVIIASKYPRALYCTGHA